MKPALSLAASASLAAVLLAPASARAAGATPQAKASIAVLHPLTLIRRNDLDFGMLTRTGAGTAVINPNTNVMTTTGAVTALGGLPTAATFIAHVGSPFLVLIRVPTGPVLITRVGGTQTMSVSNWTVEGGTWRLFPSQQTFEFRVGARLNVGATQAEGSYVGQFNVTVEYF